VPCRAAPDDCCWPKCELPISSGGVRVRGQMYGPAVRCKRLWSTLADAGLASMYSVSDWSMCSRPSWISARMRSHERIGLVGPFGSPVFARAGKDRSSIVVSSSRRTRRVKGITSSIASWLCAVPLFVPGGRSFVPTCGCRGASRAGTVKVGRRGCLASRAGVARPRLDGPEHGARIKRVGTRLHCA
jgi:hypothetical protein